MVTVGGERYPKREKVNGPMSGWKMGADSAVGSRYVCSWIQICLLLKVGGDPCGILKEG